MAKKKIRHLVIILGDQLSHNLSSLESFDPTQDAVLMMEVDDEARYVPHHPQKIILVLAAMRHFAAALRRKSYPVYYIKLESLDNRGSFTACLENFLSNHSVESILITHPGEYRVLQMIEQWSGKMSIPVSIKQDTRFFCTLAQFEQWIQNTKQPRMENFYRQMRQQTGLLMEANKPIGGKWNFDRENRKPAKQGMAFPKPVTFSRDDITNEVIDLVKSRFDKHFGDIDSFNYAVTRQQALIALKHFIEYGLSHFGDYQDAMLEGEYYLHHSILSPYLNVGLLEPKEVCTQVISAYEKNKLAINNVEGFIRQILGWREYVRGIYWHKMPQYQDLNYLKATRDLPSFYWDGNTKMACMKHVIEQTKQIGHSHHIQRLMVTGNFALLADIEPKQICEWYLAVYVDAYDWVELPNTLGMTMYADGGYLASKPYAASGNYINKMSNFCGNCHYNVKEKIGENACPFNYLYWNFLMEHEQELKKNPRLSYPYNHLQKMPEKQKQQIKQDAKQFLDKG